MNDQNNNYGQPVVQYPPMQTQPGYPTTQPQPQQYGVPQQPMQPQPNYAQQMAQPPQQPMVQQQMAQPMLQQLPQYFTPDSQQMVDAYQQHRLTMSRGSNINFVKFLGPNGEDKWDSVPVNYTSMLRLYLLPPWAQGKHIFATAKSHFWKSTAKPQGASITCPGPDRCLTCKARIQGLESPDENQQKKAREFGRVSTNNLYQVALLDNMGVHFEGGLAKPYVLRAGSRLHAAIGNLIEDKSISIFDPMNGRPLRIKKTKVGPNRVDIEYACTDEDPSPLPQVLWPLLQNLIDLDAINKMPTDEEMMAAVQDMGLLLPQAGNPYQMQPQQPMMQQPMPNMVQPGYAPNPNPPPMNPPPVNSAPNAGNYAPQPSQELQVQPQAQPMQPPVKPQPLPTQVAPPMVRQPMPQPKTEPPTQSLVQLQQAISGK